MRNLTLVVFKTLTISKIVFLALLIKSVHHVVKELEKVQKYFLWKNSTLKIKHETTCKDYKDGGLKNVDIPCKIVSLQCSWIRLYDDYFYEWKLIPLHLITMSFGSRLKLHSNLFLKRTSLKKLLPFYKDIFINWKTLQVLKPQLAFFRIFIV